MRVTGGRTAAAGWLVLTAALGLIAARPAAAAPAVVNVPADVATIQAAIDTAPTGGTVVVAPGIYYEHIDFHGKQVEVRSASGPASTVIDGGGTGTVVLFEHFETRATVLRGFTVRSGATSGIRIQNSSPTVAGNVVTANAAYEGGGLFVLGSSALITDNVVRGNHSGDGAGGGFYVGEADGTEIVGNVVADNTATYDAGAMELWNAREPVIRNNVFRGNRSGARAGGIQLVNDSQPLISQNLFVDNQARDEGGAIQTGVPLGNQGPTLAGNTFVDNDATWGSAIFSSGDYLAVNNVITGQSSTGVVECEGTIAPRYFYNDVFNYDPAGRAFRFCADVTGIVGNLSVDPRLAPDQSPTATSPVVDAGHDDPAFPALPATDANGAPRVVDGNGDGIPVVDMGAYESPDRGLTADALAPAGYHPLTPARILDTRIGLGAPAAPLGAGATLALQVTGRGGVPAGGVSAVVVNVTVTGPTAPSYLTAWPAGEALPPTASLTYLAGQTVPNLVVVKVGADGKVNVRNNAGSTHVVADVAGWYGDFRATGGSRYNPVSGARILDTRIGLGAPTAPIGPGGTVALQVAGHGGLPASGVSAVVLNVTATGPTIPSYLTAWPSGEALPPTANLTYVAGQTVSNLVMVKVGPDGGVNLRNSFGSTDVVADVTGWYGEDGAITGARFTPVTPDRILDTRIGLGAPARPLGEVDLDLAGKGGLPADGITAVALNVTVTGGTAPSYLTIWGAGDPWPPTASLTFAAGQTVSNLVVVKATNGYIYIDNAMGATQVIADVAGWFGS